MTVAASSLRKLGKYELVAQIGEGGMAEVHLARQRGPRQFEKIVVVKTVRETLSSKPEVASMLLEEARIAALVKHPNVVDIYDLGEENGTFFIAMEYLEGESLSAILKVSRQGKRLDPFSTARIIADCAAGLHAAHELRSFAGDPLELVHQDVTPGNVIVLYSGQVKLVDFGVAKIRSSVDDGLVKGKTGYLAPEVLDGAPADRRSDIWSLGVVLWECLTLRRLFAGKSEDEQIARIRAADVPPPSTLSSSVPRDLDDIVASALARDPARRYRTAQAMQADLMQILRHASWSGGSEPIARFMRSVFVERIQARRELLKELASGKKARATTIDRIQAIRDEGPADGVPREVIGAHGTGSRPAALPLPAPEDSQVRDPIVEVQVSDADEPEVEVSVDTPLPAAPLPDVTPVPRRSSLRRRVTIGAIVGGAAVGAIGAALALGLGKEAPRADEPGPRNRGRVTAAKVEPAEPVAVDAAVEEVVEVAAVDAGVEAAVVARVEEARHEVEHRSRHSDRDRKRARERERERDRDDEVPPPPDPTPERLAVPATAKSLYKEGLQRFVAGDTDVAIKLFDQARAKDSRYAPAYRGLGMAYERKGDKKRAVRAFDTYLRLAPSASDAASIRERLERLR